MIKKSMRDVLIDEIHKRMEKERSIFFLSADLGAPALDRLRDSFPDRCINVGIAEQNLINVATGLALEGFTVYGYGIAAFIVMRCYEQIRTNLSLMAQTRNLNVNLIGVGSGLSYNLSGPTHHCLEDIALMRLLPNFMVLSPSDWMFMKQLVALIHEKNTPKYIRLEGQPVFSIYKEDQNFYWKEGFLEPCIGKDLCLVSTGIMTHKALKIAGQLRRKNVFIGVIDVCQINPIKEESLYNAIKKYKRVFTMEEGFIRKGGLDSMVETLLNDRKSDVEFNRFGFNAKHVFELGSREELHYSNSLNEKTITEFLYHLSGN